MRREGLLLCFHFTPELAVLPQKKVIGLKKSKLRMNGCFIIGLSGFVIKGSSFLDSQNPSGVQIIS
jgi:hypothetical protein